MVLEQIEVELKKRWAYPYQWGRKQNNAWDKQTQFIYSVNTFSQLQERLNEFKDLFNFLELQNYAFNRWYNFKSAQAIEYIFCSHSKVNAAANPKDREKDFYINNLAFDHKTTVFPKGFSHTLDYTTKRRSELLKWLYINQSKQQRFHLKNRLFLMLHSKSNEHWKLKAELKWLNILIWDYLDAFDNNQLLKLKHSKGIVVCDILVCVR